MPSQIPQDSEKLLPLVYEELRKLAADWLQHERPGQTLSATALVHEAFLRLTKRPQAAEWDNRGHFFAAAAEAMRRILIEQARKKATLKRGKGAARLQRDSLSVATSDSRDAISNVNCWRHHLRQQAPGRLLFAVNCRIHPAKPPSVAPTKGDRKREPHCLNHAGTSASGGRG